MPTARIVCPWDQWFLNGHLKTNAMVWSGFLQSNASLPDKAWPHHVELSGPGWAAWSEQPLNILQVASCHPIIQKPDQI